MYLLGRREAAKRLCAWRRTVVMTLGKFLTYYFGYTAAKY